MKSPSNPGDLWAADGVRARKLLWLPSLLTGVVLAATLGTAAGILLYNAPGLGRATAALLVVSGIALVAGIRVSFASGDWGVAAMRRSWWGLLGALTLGALFVVVWELAGGYGAVPLAQGAGLAVVAALPACFAGGVWGRMALFAASLGPGDVLRVLRGGALGAALGAVAMMELLGRPVFAATVMLGAAVMASAAARIQGWLFDRVPVRGGVRRMPDRPELCFTLWRTTIPERCVRLLRDGESDRVIDPAPPGDWRSAVATTLNSSTPLLFVGVGSWFAAGRDCPWRILDPDPALLTLAAAGFEWTPEHLADPEEPGSLLQPDAGEVGGEGHDAAGAGVGLGQVQTVIAECGASTALWQRILALPAVERIWLGGRAGAAFAPLAEVAQQAGFAAVRYLGTRPGHDGPPTLSSCHQEVWLFDRTGSASGHSADAAASLHTDRPIVLPRMKIAGHDD